MSIARLTLSGDHYVLADQRIFNPSWVKKTDYAEDLANAAHFFYEGASWNNGGPDAEVPDHEHRLELRHLAAGHCNR